MERIVIVFALIAAFIVPYTEQRITFFWEEDCKIEGEKWHYIRTFKDDKIGKCSLNDIGYQPSGRDFGRGTDSIASTNKQNDFISGITGVGTNAAAVAEKAVTGYDAFAKTLNKKGEEVLNQLKRLAPKLAASFGILGLGLTLFSQSLSPEQELIDMTNLAFAKLSEKMNKQMDQLKDYTDDKVFTLERDVMNRELKTMEAFWANCILENKVMKILDCQKDVSKLYRASSSKFYIFYDLMRTNPEALDRVQVKRLEVSLIPLRQYVMMSMFVIETLKDSYKTKKGPCDFRYQSCLKASISDMKKFKVYFNWAVNHILSVHTYKPTTASTASATSTQRTYCEDHVTCESVKNTTNILDPDTFYYKCGCALDPVWPGIKCYIKHEEFEKPNIGSSKEHYDWFCAKSADDFMRKNTTIVLKPEAERFVVDFVDKVDYFWRAHFSYDKIVEVLKASEEEVKTSTCYKNQAKRSLNLMLFDDLRFSPDFGRRMEKVKKDLHLD